MEEHYAEWCAYAKRAGLLDENGVATDRKAAQTSFNAFAAAWNSCAKADADYKGALMALVDRSRYSLLGASNYIDVLGGVSQSYRQLIADIDARLP